MSLPPGETDPNKLYIAVGRAIHAWEQMEESFARLYAKMKGLPEDPHALTDYGNENNRFGKRADALQRASEIYFTRCPDQHREAVLHQLITNARDLSIKRHRIAHGHITQWAEIKLPEGSGHHQIQITLPFRWGAPWYSMGTLRTDPIGGDAASINTAHDEFQAINIRIIEYTSQIKSP